MESESCFIKRNETKKIYVRDIPIGGASAVTVQSMTNTDTRNVHATVEQIKRLEDAGCDIVRVAVPDKEAASCLKEITTQVKIPVVADIHYDFRLAIESMENGADKIRLNPGNIGSRERVREVAVTALQRNVPIRIGVNSGSIEKHILEKFGGVTAAGMVESAISHASMLEECGFDNIVFSLKASSVPLTIEAYRLMARRTQYPLHIGVTEAGTVYKGTVKSSVGIGCLLAEGIGDTIRVSLTGDPVEEVKAGIEILKSLDLRKKGVEIISCPTCGRCRIDLVNIVNRLEEMLKNVDRDIKVAVMGCSVNGPGEAKEADIGIAGGHNEALLFKKGEIVRKIPGDRIVQELMLEIERM
jgi:(E)-4-hydroxy-3-methylbut-2-enyl-diphosphate synthase